MKAGSRASWLAGTAAALGAFWWIGSETEYARRGFGIRRLLPPVYASSDLQISWRVLLAVALGAAWAGAALVWARRGLPRAAVLVPMAVGFLFSFSIAVAMVRGDPRSLTRSINPGSTTQYTVDVPLARDGVRRLNEHYPRIVREELRSHHSMSHPPGPLVILSALERMSPSRLGPRAFVLVALASLMVIPAWFLARELFDDRVASWSVVLAAAVPSVVLHAATSMDAVFAPVLLAGAATLAAAMRRRHDLLAVAGGMALGVGTYLTYATAFVALFAAVFAAAALGARRALRPLLLAAAGGVAGLLLLRACGFDVLASMEAMRERLAELNASRAEDRPYAYWVLGNPAAWLIMAGLPVAAFAVREVLARRPRGMLSMLVPLGLFYLLPVGVTGLIPGEVERTLLFAYPFASAAAAACLVRDRARMWPLVGVSALQTILFESLLFFSY